jgi:tetratricopeptide (TPR) repeat protein
VRQGEDPGWDDLWAAVPLTGREPVLGRLRLRLRHGPAGGWIGISGPTGAGVSRVLAEAAMLVATEPGARVPLVVAPCPPGSPPYEALRRALLPWWRAGKDETLRAALDPVVPAVGGGARALLEWLGAGPLAAEACVPPYVVLRAAVAALTEGGAVTADDWDAVEARTRRLLLDLAENGRTTVFAGLRHADTSTPPAPGPTWPLEPLSEAQIELLIRRWLHAAVTARRLAPEIALRSDGWPGRAVALVRGLAQAGAFERSPRGITIANWPRSFAPAASDGATLLRRWKARGAATWRIVETAALLTEPIPAGLLAEAAGVKRGLVEDLLEEASAARGGAAPGCLFGDPTTREQTRARLTPTRHSQAALRWARAWTRGDPREDRGVGLALARLESLVAVGAGPELEEALRHVCTQLPRDLPPTLPALDVLQRAGSLLAARPVGGSGRTLLRLADCLGAAGRREAAVQLLDALGALPQGSAEERDAATLRLRFGSDDARGAARERLRASLTIPGPRDPGLYAAWSALAEDPDAPPADARRAWRAALACLEPGDVDRRAALHVGLGAAATRGRRLRAAAGHGRRAAALFEAQGRVAEAARCWSEVGRCEAKARRWSSAERAFQAAARAWHALGDGAAECEALVAQGNACLEVSAHDDAVALLERALVCIDTSASPERLAGVHLVLARAHYGRGDVGGERRHAAHAVEHAGSPKERLAARAAWLTAEVRGGAPGAVEDLPEVAQALEAAGLPADAAAVRETIVDARLRAGELREAERWSSMADGDPAARLRRARLQRLQGHSAEAAALLEQLGRDVDASVDQRAEAYARLAELQCEQSMVVEAAQAAQAASALLQVPRRKHTHDPRIHRLLARVFRGVGARARSVEHRAAARRTLRLPPSSEVGAPTRRRIARALWLDDPRPRAPQPLSVAV